MEINQSYNLGFLPHSLFIGGTDLNDEECNCMDDVYNKIISKKCSDIIFYDIKSNLGVIKWYTIRLIAEGFLVSVITPYALVPDLTTNRAILPLDYVDYTRIDKELLESLTAKDVIIVVEEEEAKVIRMLKEMKVVCKVLVEHFNSDFLLKYQFYTVGVTCNFNNKLW